MQTVNLTQRHLIEFWIELAQARATGTLRLERGHVRKSLAFFEGDIVGVESTLPRESLTTLLTDSKDLDAADLVKLESTIAQRSCTEAAAIAGLKLVEPARLLDAMRERIAACALEGLAWQSGEATFDSDAKPGPDARRLRCDALDLAHRAAALHLPADRLGGPLIDAGGFFATVAEGRDVQLRSWIGDDVLAIQILRNLDGNHRFELAVAAAYPQPRALAALWLAQRTDGLDFAEGAVSSADTSEALSAARVADASEQVPDIEIEVIGIPSARAGAGFEARAAARSTSSRDVSAEAEEIRKAVANLHATLGDATHYEILGVKRDDIAGAVKKAYFKAAKRFHPDKLARLGLEDIRDQAAEVFAALAEANEVLSEPARRKEYDERLASGGAADIDLARLSQAEGFFRKSQVLVKMGDFRGASELLRSAVQLWPEESEYHAALGFSLFKKNPTDLEGARAALEAAIGVGPGNAQAHMWLSLVHRASGDINESARHAKRARELDPKVS